LPNNTTIIRGHSTI